MLPSRFPSGQSSAMRKSRLEGKPSLLPKPRRPGSIDRLSTEARRPSSSVYRSSSADTRTTYGGRLSREASATKLPTNMMQRSRSQQHYQGDRHGQSSMTPLRSSNRMTTTPMRTPTDDRSSRNWQSSLDRALAFVTIKDQRPISVVAWQRAAMARVSAALGARAGGAALVRPLTIARFVDICGALLNAILRDTKLNTDTYVTKLPHLAKRLLYPGTMSKSWLKSANTLHAFPHALALITYLLDLAEHIELPVSEDWLYAVKDKLACLRRDYVYNCWNRFQTPGYQFDDLNEEYLQKVAEVLGNDEEKIPKLQQDIKKLEEELADAEASSARAEEARRAARRDALLGALRAARAARAAAGAQAHAARAALADRGELLRQLELDQERASAEDEQLQRELAQQAMCVAERERLLRELQYASRVRDSKRALALQIADMVSSKEAEVTSWLEQALQACSRYKRGLLPLSALYPQLAAPAIDENELMSPSCAPRVLAAAQALRALAAAEAERRAQRARSNTARARKQCALLEECRANITEIKSVIARAQQALEADTAREAADCAAWGSELADLTARADRLAAQTAHYERLERELDFWEDQDLKWRKKLEELRESIERTRAEATRLLEAKRARHVAVLVASIKAVKEPLLSLTKECKR